VRTQLSTSSPEAVPMGARRAAGASARSPSPRRLWTPPPPLRGRRRRFLRRRGGAVALLLAPIEVLRLLPLAVDLHGDGADLRVGAPFALAPLGRAEDEALRARVVELPAGEVAVAPRREDRADVLVGGAGHDLAAVDVEAVDGRRPP
jgi:hypothetical protein